MPTNGLGTNLRCLVLFMMNANDEQGVPVSIGALARDAMDRAALRRAFGVSLLRAWRVLGGLLARVERVEDIEVESASLDRALRALDDVRSALSAMRDASRLSRPTRE